MNQRSLSLDILCRTFDGESYTNLEMRKELEKLPVQQRPFCIELINGVLRHYRYLEYQFLSLIDKKTDRRKRMILAMAVYERFYLREKEYAVNNEYASLGKNAYERSFLNAVLRKIDHFKTIEGESPSELAVRYSLPDWLCNLIVRQYPVEHMQILKKLQERSTVYYRLNHRKASYDDLKDLPIEIQNEDIFTSENNLLNTKEFTQGLFYVQDLFSNEIVRHLDLKEDSIFLDMCAAPGGKFFNALDTVKEENAYANDLHEHRVELIRKQAEKLGFPHAHYTVSDARELSSVYEPMFDRILIDAPCSGLGVMGRRADIRYHIQPSSLDELVSLQKEILEEGAKLLKQGGILLYSTCTINRKENERQIHSFLAEHNDFELMEERLILEEKGDNFYYAKLKKV